MRGMNIFPFAGEVRRASGEREAMPVENPRRHGNRGNKALFEHNRRSTGAADSVEPSAKGFVKPWCGWPNYRAWRAARFDQVKFGRRPVDARLHDKQIGPDVFFPLSQPLADVERQGAGREHGIGCQHHDGFRILANCFESLLA